MNQLSDTNLSLATLEDKLWKRATNPLLKQLAQSGKDNLSELDLFAWLLQQAGRLERGEIERAELNTIIALFMDQAHQLLRDGRHYCRYILRLLLLLCAAPEADSRTRPTWRDQLRSNRFLMQTLLGENPSITLFVRDMIHYAWSGARSDAVLALASRNRNGRPAPPLPQDCPWSAAEIFGFDPFDTNDVLIDGKAVPLCSYERHMKRTASAAGSPLSAIKQ